MKDSSLPKRIVECLTPVNGVPVVLSADEILGFLNKGLSVEQCLTIKRLRPRLSEMRRDGLIEKVEGQKNNGKRSVSGWRLKEA